jgi:hypothetical protein
MNPYDLKFGPEDSMRLVNFCFQGKKRWDQLVKAGVFSGESKNPRMHLAGVNLAHAILVNHTYGSFSASFTDIYTSKVN